MYGGRHRKQPGAVTGKQNGSSTGETADGEAYNVGSHRTRLEKENVKKIGRTGYGHYLVTSEKTPGSSMSHLGDWQRDGNGSEAKHSNEREDLDHLAKEGNSRKGIKS